MPTIALSSLNGANGFRLDGAAASDQSGYAVHSAGDVNGDGYDDIIIGAFGADPNGAESGESYVVFGKAGGFDAAVDLGALDGFDESEDLGSLDGVHGFRITGISPDDESGRAVAGAGDINGDGFADIIIGAFRADVGGAANAGESYVIFGHGGDFADTIDLFFLNGANGFRLNGVDASDNSGVAVAGAGDVNGDGLDDLIVGAFGADPDGRANAGESYVVFGRSTGFSSVLSLADLDGVDGFRLIGADESDTSGVSVASAGDVNGDDIDDLIIGAFAADPAGRSGAGESYIVFGREDGFGANVDLAELDGTDGFAIRGVDPYDTSGVTVGSAGDINSDGFADVIIGAFAADPDGDASAGESYVVFGKAGGFGPRINLIGLDGEDGFRLDGVDAGDQSGFSVAGVGDFNGDGFDDILIGAFKADIGSRKDAGESYLIFGKADGFGAVVSLTGLAGTDGFRLTGDGARDFSGADVAGAGDVDGDGFDDLLIGAFLSSAGGAAYAGASYVVFGGDFTSSLTHPGGDNDDILNGTAGADVMVGGQGDDQLRGGDGLDSLRGGGGDDLLEVADMGFLRIDGGAGTDTLRLTGDGLEVDFTAAGSQRVAEIEGLDLAGDDISVILDLPALRQFSTSGDAFRIDGGAGDRVTLLDSGWRLTASDETEQTLQNGATKLTVGGAVALDLFQPAAIVVSALDGAEGFRMEGLAAGDMAGVSVSRAGDVNGDELGDVIVSAPGADASYVVFGRTDGFDGPVDLSALNSLDGFRIDGAGDRAATARDMNGDGVDDIVVADETTGASHVIFGRDETTFAATLDVSDLDGDDGFTITGAASVADAGDIDGDGMGDLILSDPTANGGAGESYVVLGGISSFPATLDVASLNGPRGFKIVGAEAGDASGTAVHAAGDFNGDGLADLLVAARAVDPDGSTAEVVAYLINGRAGGFGASVDLGALDGASARRILGAADVAYAATSAEAAGDVNGDGFGDIIVSTVPVGGDGASFVVFGGGGTGAIDLSALDGADGFRLGSVQAGDGVGYTATGLGDVNGDGFGDLLVAAPGTDRVGVADAGSTFVVFGRADGFLPEFDLAALTGPDGFSLDGAGVGDGAGTAAAAAGDVNGDGFADIILGAPMADYDGGADSGAAFVYFGGGASEAATHIGTSGGDDITGSDGDDYVLTLQGDDKFDLLAGDDFLFGGVGRDRGSMGDGDDVAYGGGGRDVIDGGLGDDVLHGGDGNDQLILGYGRDTAYGGAGDDTIKERAEKLGPEDHLYGGEGRRDTLYLRSGGELDLSTIGTFEGIERIRVAGGQEVYSIDLDLRWTGRSSAETFNLGAGFDKVKAGGSADVIMGGAGDDVLKGQGGDDVIEGAAGDDRIKGADGADVFLFKPGFDQDRIYDFEVGIDRLDVSAFGLTDLATDIAPGAVMINGRAVIYLEPESRIVLVGVDIADLDDGDFIF